MRKFSITIALLIALVLALLLPACAVAKEAVKDPIVTEQAQAQKDEALLKVQVFLLENRVKYLEGQLKEAQRNLMTVKVRQYAADEVKKQAEAKDE